MVIYWYVKGLFCVEDDLFYENNKRIGYFEDEKEDEIKKNNYEKTVDRLDELREINIELKRDNKKIRKENEELRGKIDYYKTIINKWINEK